jgi:hypothetical protein
MRAILDICEQHGRPPSWWDGLSEWDQHLLLASRNDKTKKVINARKTAERNDRRQAIRGRRSAMRGRR